MLESGGTAPHVNCGVKIEVRSQLHEPVGLPIGKETRAVTEYQGGWDLASAWKVRQKKNPFTCRKSHSDSLVNQPHGLINKLTELCRLGVTRVRKWKDFTERSVT
jgi:hypothetical protein